MALLSWNHRAEEKPTNGTTWLSNAGNGVDRAVNGDGPDGHGMGNGEGNGKGRLVLVRLDDVTSTEDVKRAREVVGGLLAEGE